LGQTFRANDLKEPIAVREAKNGPMQLGLNQFNDLYHAVLLALLAEGANRQELRQLLAAEIEPEESP